jgi:putative hydrolase of the HAD superfamily
MQSYKNLFFDLDDTLWDTYSNNKESLEELYSLCGFGSHYPSFEAFFNYYQPHNDDLWRQYSHGVIDRKFLIIDRFRYVLAPMGIDDDEKALQISRTFMNITSTKTATVHGAEALLDYLGSKYRLFIISNGFREVQHRKLASAGLADYFERVILSEDVGARKPSPEIFTAALKSTNSRRKESIMIGDNFDTDMTGAKESGIDQIWFNPHGERPIGFIPTYTVGSLDEIRRLL